MNNESDIYDQLRHIASLYRIQIHGGYRDVADIHEDMLRVYFNQFEESEMCLPEQDEYFYRLGVE